MTPTEFIRETSELVRSIETRFVELGARLYRIRQESLWQGIFDSYGAFLDSVNITKGNASMLASIYENYVVIGKKKTEDLAGVAYSNLYASIPLIEKDGVDKALAVASTLTRSEIQDEVREVKHGEHTHVPKDNSRFAVCECGKMFLDEKTT